MITDKVQVCVTQDLQSIVNQLNFRGYQGFCTHVYQNGRNSRISFFKIV